LITFYFQYGTKSIECVRQPLSEYEGKIDLGDFIQTVDADNYFTYPGSLTTPSCAEVVIWTVFPRLITINNDQVN
jgi:carbonic anhydrase